MTTPQQQDLLTALQQAIDTARAARAAGVLPNLIHLPGDPVITYPTGRDTGTGTRWFFGRPYHWILVDGRHTLQPGPDPWETP